MFGQEIKSYLDIKIVDVKLMGYFHWSIKNNGWDFNDAEDNVSRNVVDGWLWKAFSCVSIVDMKYYFWRWLVNMSCFAKVIFIFTLLWNFHFLVEIQDMTKDVLKRFVSYRNSYLWATFLKFSTLYDIMIRFQCLSSHYGSK